MTSITPGAAYGLAQSDQMQLLFWLACIKTGRSSVMKTIFGVFASLLLVTTLAFGQQLDSELPFPQSANPALQNGTYPRGSESQITCHPSMAINQDVSGYPPAAPRCDRNRICHSQWTPIPRSERTTAIPTSFEGGDSQFQPGRHFQWLPLHPTTSDRP